MQTHQTSDQTPGKILDHGAGIGEANETLVEQRAKELAAIVGLPSEGVTDDFRRQARLELSGRTDPDISNDDSGPVAELVRFDDVPGESGIAASASPSDDEKTIGESLYSEGVEEADHDRMTESRKQERRDES